MNTQPIIVISDDEFDDRSTIERVTNTKILTQTNESITYMDMSDSEITTLKLPQLRPLIPRVRRPSYPPVQQPEQQASVCCPICLKTPTELEQDRTYLQALHCGHLLCYSCERQVAREAKELKKEQECPICRRPADQKSIRLFF